jgi:fructose-bisphosphate aldolase class II
VILQAGPSAAHTPLPILGKMFRHLAENASVPVVAHLDHGYTFEECREALDSGFTSLMFDGSRKPLDQNIAETARIAEMAHEPAFPARARSVLSAIRAARPRPAPTRKKPRALPARPASTPWRSRSAMCTCSRTRKAGWTRTAHPRHRGADRGAAGHPRRLRRAVAQRTALARGSRICKFNIGTELRMAFGAALREAVNRRPGPLRPGDNPERNPRPGDGGGAAGDPGFGPPQA